MEVPYALTFTTMIVMRSQARWSESRMMESQDSSVEAFDLLCLALGLVMNWATLNPKVAVLSRTECKVLLSCNHKHSSGLLAINPMCPGSRPCARACQCPDRKSILECLTSLHVRYSDNRQDDPPECAFLRGYTAILVGLLVKDDPANQSIVMSTLPGVSPSDKIKSLITRCHSFLDFYSDTTPSPSSDSPRASPEVTTPGASGRHRATWDKKGEQIARSVIASLEIICNP